MRAILVLMVVAVGVSSATVAFGAIGDSATITACVNRSTRNWTVLTAGTCKASEDAVELYTKSGADAAFLTETAADAAYLGKTETAADSDLLDGMDSSGFMATTNCISYPHQGIDWHGCDLQGANLSAANLFRANLSGVNMADANLSGVNLQEANLSGARMAFANLSGARMGFANLSGANLGGVTWSDTICPDGTNSDNNGGTCQGHL
jgi:Pentapeptide repeats (8 copies)